MQEFTVTLGGRELPLRYNIHKDIEEIEAEFPRPDGIPGDIGNLATAGSGSLKVQTAFLWYGVRHNKGITRDQVRKWFLDYLQGGGKRNELLLPMWRAVGRDLFGAAPVEEVEEEEGKATPSTNPDAAVPRAE